MWIALRWNMFYILHHSGNSLKRLLLVTFVVSVFTLRSHQRLCSTWSIRLHDSQLNDNLLAHFGRRKSSNRHLSHRTSRLLHIRDWWYCYMSVLRRPLANSVHISTTFSKQRTTAHFRCSQDKISRSNRHGSKRKLTTGQGRWKQRVANLLPHKKYLQKACKLNTIITGEGKKPELSLLVQIR